MPAVPAPGTSNVVRGPVARPQEAVIHLVCVIVVSRDCSRRVDGHGLDVDGYGAGGIERDVASGFRLILRA